MANTRYVLLQRIFLENLKRCVQYILRQADIHIGQLCQVDRTDSSVGKETRCGLEVSLFDPRWGHYPPD